ncbi:MAG: choice-of-anchor D domain-containing protein, partial [Candidatus Cloacimonetes bacterium]|nr:choice-of-anchor D domain-containing protein [Candidatus Cloacimonadota bacterium]
VMGGLPGWASMSCETYNYQTNQWETVASTYYPYSNFSSEVLNDERVLAIRSWCELYTWNYTPIVSQPQNHEQGTIGDILIFSVTASDPDSDSIAVRINWGDNEITEWSELKPSGTTFEFSHAWFEPGQYEIRSQTADQWHFLNEECHNSISEWSEPLIVTISGTPEILVLTEQLDFGTVYVGLDSTKTIMISNLGNGVLEAEPSTNTDEFSVYPSSFNIEPGENLEIEITFTPTYEGIIRDTLTILSNDPENPEIEIFLTGEGQIQVSIDDEFNNAECVMNNFPNPFNPSTTIEFSIQNDSKIELSIYNIKGQKIKLLAQNEFTKGSHSILWNGNDESGKPVTSGIYYYKLNVNGKTEAMNKCLLLK